MPSVSKKQHNFMAAVAKNPSFAKKVGIKPSVGEEFLKADKGKTFREGGTMKESKSMMEKEVAFMKKKGAPKSMLKHEMAEAGMKKGGMASGGKVSQLSKADGVAIKGKSKGKEIKMCGGGYMKKGK